MLPSASRRCQSVSVRLERVNCLCSLVRACQLPRLVACWSIAYLLPHRIASYSAAAAAALLRANAWLAGTTARLGHRLRVVPVLSSTCATERLCCSKCCCNMGHLSAKQVQQLHQGWEEVLSLILTNWHLVTQSASHQQLLRLLQLALALAAEPSRCARVRTPDAARQCVLLSSVPCTACRRALCPVSILPAASWQLTGQSCLRPVPLTAAWPHLP